MRILSHTGSPWGTNGIHLVNLLIDLRNRSWAPGFRLAGYPAGVAFGAGVRCHFPTGLRERR